MATFSVTIPDTAVPRIQVAFGHPDPNNPTVWVNGTLQDVQAAIKGFLKTQVLNYETTQAAIADRVTRTADVNTW